jgi:hypothetical protein
MANPNELRADLIEARADLQAAFHDAHQNWEKAPKGGEGEDSWAPNQAAEHAIETEVYFTSSIAVACGAPALEAPALDCSTPANAAATLTRVSALCDRTLRYVSEGDLAKTYKNPQGDLRTVEKALSIMASHDREHAEQIRAGSR